MGRTPLTLLPALILIAAPMVRAETIRVSADRPGTTIQDALDAAAAGDTVEIACGTYYEYGIVMKEGVTLRSETGDTNCVTVDAESNGSVMVCTGLTGATVIEGIRFTGGASANGGGMYCDWASPVVASCAFVANEAGTSGGGMYLTGASQPELTACVFRGNDAQDGGGVYAEGAGSWFRAHLCSFINNDTYEGGAASFADSSDAEFVECRFAYNDATTFGGGILSSGGVCDISGCTFYRNTAGRGGAFSVGGPSLCTTEFSFFHENDADLGGVFYGFAFSPTRALMSMANCTLVGNTATFSGHAMFLRQNFLTNIDRCIIVEGSGGNPIECEEPVQPYPSLACCDIYGNAGGDWVGCIAGQYLDNGNFSEDPVFCLDETPDLPYSLHDGSPCLPEDSPCGQLVGAFDQGCGDEIPVENVSWGTLKAMYR